MKRKTISLILNLTKAEKGSMPEFKVGIEQRLKKITGRSVRINTVEPNFDFMDEDILFDEFIETREISFFNRLSYGDIYSR